MSQATKSRTHVDHKKDGQQILADAYAIAKAMYSQSLAIIERGEDPRSNNERPGVATLQHLAEKAIGEIIRLGPVCGVAENVTTDKIIVGWEYKPDEEAALLKLKSEIEAQA